MGKKEIADEFYKRAQNYRNVYNPATSFMQPRDEKGNFAANFSPDDYTEDICESNGWQYFWSVPQDLTVWSAWSEARNVSLRNWTVCSPMFRNRQKTCRSSVPV